MQTSNYFDRSGRKIQRDMLRWIQENFRARVSEDWDLTGEHYDPLVNMIIGACAFEMQNIYDQLYSAESRLLKKLEDVLLPDAANMPLPAHALATALPKGTSCRLSPGDSFVWKNNDPGNDFPAELGFRPLVGQNLIQGEVRYLATDMHFFKRERKGLNKWKRFRREESGDRNRQEHSRNLYLGLLVDPVIESLEGVSLYLDLETDQRSASRYDSLRDIFLAAVGDARLSIHDISLNTRKGLETPHADYADYASRKGKMLHRILSRYNAHFILITDELQVDDFDGRLSGLPSFLEGKISEPDWAAEQDSSAAEKLRPLWLRLELPFSVTLPDPEMNLECAINRFPLANLELLQKDDSDTYFNKSSLNMISLKPELPFVCIDRLFEKGEEKKPYRPLEFSRFLKAGENTFTVRETGVGRLDDYNAWDRLAYLLRLFRKELKEDLLLERLSNEFSLEELHEFIRYQRPEKAAKTALAHEPVYILLNTGSLAFGGKRVVVEYYTTNAEKANNLPAGLQLEGGAQIENESCRLLQKTRGGKGKRSRLEQISHLRSSLLTRGRITTPADVEAYCKQFFEEDRMQVKVSKGVYVDPRPGFGPLRAIRVSLKAPEDFRVPNEDLETESRLLARELEERATMFLPFLVQFETE